MMQLKLKDFCSRKVLYLDFVYQPAIIPEEYKTDKETISKCNTFVDRHAERKEGMLAALDMG